jgi:hypothetical protein
MVEGWNLSKFAPITVHLWFDSFSQQRVLCEAKPKILCGVLFKVLVCLAFQSKRNRGKPNMSEGQLRSTIGDRSDIRPLFWATRKRTRLELKISATLALSCLKRRAFTRGLSG